MSEDEIRSQIVAVAANEITGLVHAKRFGDPDETGRPTRQGWQQLLNYFRLAAPGIWSDDLIKYNASVGTDGIPHWCGIFALWAVKIAGAAVGTWKMGHGIASVDGIRQVFPKSSVQIGDIGYLADKNHHFIVSAIGDDETVKSIDGNSGVDSEITSGNRRMLSQIHSFYTVF